MAAYRNIYGYVYIYGLALECAHTHTLLCQLRDHKGNNTPVKASTLSTQIVVSKSFFQ